MNFFKGKWSSKEMNYIYVKKKKLICSNRKCSGCQRNILSHKFRKKEERIFVIFFSNYLLSLPMIVKCPGKIITVKIGWRTCYHPEYQIDLWFRRKCNGKTPYDGYSVSHMTVWRKQWNGGHVVSVTTTWPKKTICCCLIYPICTHVVVYNFCGNVVSSLWIFILYLYVH